jgi:hypothetical protein
MNMHSKILAALFSLVLVTGVLSVAPQARAADPAEEKLAAVEKLGAVRVVASAKLNDLRKLLDNSANGANVAGWNLYLAYNRAVAGWNTRLQQENAKAADTRDQALIQSLTSKVEKANTMWASQSQKDAPLYTQTFAVHTDVGNQLTTLVNTLSTLDQSWVRAEIDPATMTAMFQALNKRIDEAIAATSATVEGYKKMVTERAQALQQ